MKIKKIMFYFVLNFFTFASCKHQMSSKKNDALVNVEINSTVQQQDDEEVESSEDSTKIDIPNGREELTEIRKDNKIYYYGDLKKAGYNLLYSDIYEKDGEKFQIKKHQNYKLTYSISTLKYIDRRKSGEELFADSFGNLTSDIELSNKNNRINSCNVEKLYEDKREIVEKTDKKVYEFNNYNLYSRDGKTFTSDIVDNMTFVSGYLSYDVVKNVEFRYNGYIYKIGKFKKNNSTTDEYRWLRYMDNEDVSLKYKEGYKYTTNDIKKDINGYIAFVPIQVAYGEFNYDMSIPGAKDSLDTSMCYSCSSALCTKNRQLVNMFIPRSEYDLLNDSAAEHNIHVDASNVSIFQDQYQYNGITPYYEGGTYMSRFQDKIYKPSHLNLVRTGKKIIDNKDRWFWQFEKVNKLNCTNSNAQILFKNTRKGYTKEKKI